MSDMNLQEAIRMEELNRKSIEQLERISKIIGSVGETVDYTHIAIDALEKQIPKKSNKAIDTSWGIKREVHVCPVCDYYLSEMNFIGDGEKVSYCEVCGQAIDWGRSETECSG